MKLKIDKMFAFVVYDEKEECEGVMGAELMPGMFMPFVGADMEKIESLKPVADKICDKIGKTYRILEFSCRKDVTGQY